MKNGGARRPALVVGARLTLIVLAGVTGCSAFATGHDAERGATVKLVAAPVLPGSTPRNGVASGLSEDRSTADAVSRSGVRRGLDPRFPTCQQARAAGFGPYLRGRDVEYRWYPDADGDAVTCD